MSELLSPLQAYRILPTIIAERPCVFKTADQKLLPLTETELWAALDEIGAWRANGRQGELSERATIVFTSDSHSARCWDIFELWQMQVKSAVC